GATAIEHLSVRPSDTNRESSISLGYLDRKRRMQKDSSADQPIISHSALGEIRLDYASDLVCCSLGHGLPESESKVNLYRGGPLPQRSAWLCWAKVEHPRILTPTTCFCNLRGERLRA